MVSEASNNARIASRTVHEVFLRRPALPLLALHSSTSDPQSRARLEPTLTRLGRFRTLAARSAQMVLHFFSEHLKLKPFGGYMKLAALLKGLATLAVVPGRFKNWKTDAKAFYRVILVCLAAGPVLTASAVQGKQTSVDTYEAFEIHIYHAMPGKLPALEARFRNTLSKLLPKHGLKVVGYWTTEDASAADKTKTLTNSFVFMVAHPSRQKAAENWDAMHADPEFQALVKSEQVDRLVEKVDTTYMHSTDFSPMK
jgi:hypothetical protein